MSRGGLSRRRRGGGGCGGDGLGEDAADGNEDGAGTGSEGQATSTGVPWDIEAAAEAEAA